MDDSPQNAGMTPECYDSPGVFLRRWCVEQAIQNTPIDALGDGGVLDHAQKIYDWVTAK